jgi:hypothetical protein
MIPMVQAPVDVSFDSGSDAAMGLGRTTRDRQRRQLLEHNRHLADENARLAEENHALREAATLWIRLYEKQLERANYAMSSLARIQPARE